MTIKCKNCIIPRLNFKILDDSVFFLKVKIFNNTNSRSNFKFFNINEFYPEENLNMSIEDISKKILFESIDLSKDDNYESVNKKLSILGANMIVESLKLIEQNKSKFVEQDENLASYAQKINKSESEINWNEKAKKIIAKINAFYPSPGSWFKHNGSRVKITKAQERILEGKPGEILKENFTIACKENSIEILELQKEGKKKMKTSEYLKGNKLEIGSNVGKNL